MMEIKEFFRYFVRVLNEGVDLSNDDLDELAEDFEKYLFDKVGEEKAKSWYPKNLVKLVMERDHPFKQKGFEPALVIHFCNYVEEGKEKYEQEMKDKDDQ